MLSSVLAVTPLTFSPSGWAANPMPDFFGIASAYRDAVAGAGVNAPRTGSDELERTKGAAAAAARARKDAAEKQAAAQAVWAAALSGQGASPTANYGALSQGTRVGSPRNEGWGQLPAGGSTEANKQIVMQLARERGWSSPELLNALDRLVMKESGYRNDAQNPTSSAYGMFQFLNSTWGPYGAKTSDPRLQALYGLQYIANRYGDPLKALNFHLNNNWY